MGRRHFHFGPTPRAMQPSLEVGCRAKHDARPDATTSEGPASRRHFLDRKATSGGSTMDNFEISSKRHCEPPKADLEEPVSSVRRVYNDHEHRASDWQVPAPLSGRRHLRGKACHMEGAASQVTRESSTPRGRRHFDPSAQPSTSSDWRHFASAPVQRRHLFAEDNLRWSSAIPSPRGQPRSEGLRCSSASPTFLDQGTAFALGSAIPVSRSEEATAAASSLSACGTPRSHTGRLHAEVEDHLKGSTWRGPQHHADCAPRRPSRRPGRDGSSLLGGSIRYAASERVPSPSLYHRPQDHMWGAVVQAY